MTHPGDAALLQVCREKHGPYHAAMAMIAMRSGGLSGGIIRRGLIAERDAGTVDLAVANPCRHCGSMEWEWKSDDFCSGCYVEDDGA